MSTYRDLSSDCETTIYGPYRGFAGKGLIRYPFWIMLDVLFQISSQLMSRKPNMNTAARVPNAMRKPVLIAFTGVFLFFGVWSMGKEQENSLSRQYYLRMCQYCQSLQKKSRPGLGDGYRVARPRGASTLLPPRRRLQSGRTRSYLSWCPSGQSEPLRFRSPQSGFRQAQRRQVRPPPAEGFCPL